IEAVDLPCVVVGLGAQAPSLDHELQLSDGTQRWLHAIADRSNLIGVRGEYTADVLARIGIKNTTVLGCPSLLTNPNPTLGKTIEQKLRKGNPKNLVVTAGMPRKMNLRQVERQLFSYLRQYEGTYIVQAPEYLVSFAREGEAVISEDNLETLYRYLQPRTARYFQSRTKFLTFARRHFRVFFDASAWIEFLSSFDMAIGTRMHGNMLSVQAGIPGICIYHDSRTQELCRVTAIPHISKQAFLGANRLQEVIKKTSFDGKAFDENRTRIARSYKALLTKSGIEVNEELDSLTIESATQSKTLNEQPLNSIP
ncbi:MAG: polysaccharide pyruvyl transferase family protein, partial [Cyanobacteria bacterium J06636_16]